MIFGVEVYSISSGVLAFEIYVFTEANKVVFLDLKKLSLLKTQAFDAFMHFRIKVSTIEAQ